MDSEKLHEHVLEHKFRIEKLEGKVSEMIAAMTSLTETLKSLEKRLTPKPFGWGKVLGFLVGPGLVLAGIIWAFAKYVPDSAQVARTSEKVETIQMEQVRQSGDISVIKEGIKHTDTQLDKVEQKLDKVLGTDAHVP